MNILVTICARSGSKRVKNKNTRLLAGKPLINYTIDLSKKWGKGTRVICSTDSKEIAEIAKKRGIDVPFIRPKELAEDTAGKVEVIRHAFKECEKIYKEKYDLVVDLDVSSPIKNAKDLDECFKIFKQKNPDIVFSVTNARRNPYFNMVELKDDGFVKLSKKPNKPVLRGQDAPKVFDMNASIYFYNRTFLENKKYVHPLSAPKAAIYIMPEIAAFDIDEKIDFTWIEYLIKNKVVEL